MENNISKLKILIILAGIFLGIFCSVEFSQANVTPPWSTTFNCADWYTGQTWNSSNCDGMDLINAGNTLSCTNKPDGFSRMDASSNNPLGIGKGWRMVIGDGSNHNTAAPRLSFPAQSELWLRWYMKFELGMSPHTVPPPSGQTNYNKLVYVRPMASGGVIDMLPDGFSWGVQGCRYPNNDVNRYSSPGSGFNGLNGYPPGSDGQGDGLWHWIEIHMKIDTNGADGIFEAWADGVQFFDIHDGNYCATPISSLTFFTNQTYATNNNCMYEYIDDIAISTTGYIGPIGTPDTTPPAAPSGVTVS